jgi:nitrogen fixation protein FixH
MNRLVFIAIGALFLSLTPVISLAATDSMGMSSMAMGSALKVSASLTPTPPKQGRAVITVSVKDHAGMPVKGATVKIASNMPSMSMTGPSVVAHETAPGTYIANENLNFATTWTFDVTASTPKQSGKSQLSADVK